MQGPFISAIQTHCLPLGSKDKFKDILNWYWFPTSSTFIWIFLTEGYGTMVVLMIILFKKTTQMNKMSFVLNLCEADFTNYQSQFLWIISNNGTLLYSFSIFRFRFQWKAVFLASRGGKMKVLPVTRGRRPRVTGNVHFTPEWGQDNSLSLEPESENGKGIEYITFFDFAASTITM